MSQNKRDDLPENPNYRPRNKAESFRQGVYFWLQALIAALVALVLVFTFIGRVIGVDGESMLPTLHDGDMIVLQQLGYTPKQGDVVVLTKKSFRDGKYPIVKRVIATGGQTVDIDYATSTVYVDGVALDEPYILETMRVPSLNVHQSHIEVPEGSICVLGDNRNNSTDSRDPIIGTVDQRCVLGRAHFILLPFQDFGGIA